MISQVNELMDLNQPLKAWELVKNSDDQELKGKVYALVRHAFDEKEYLNYYRDDLEEYMFPLKFAYSCDRLMPRFSWLMQHLIFEEGPILDIGCADGYLGLTLATLLIPSMGLNLHETSINIAKERAVARNLSDLAQFKCEDFFDHQETYPVVVFFDILEHLPDPVKGLEKAYSLVQPGGKLYISTPKSDNVTITKHPKSDQIGSWDNGLPAGHLRLFTPAEFKELLKPFQVKEYFEDMVGGMLVEIYNGN